MRVESAQRDIAEAILVSFPFLRTVFDKTLLKRFKEKQLCKSHGFLRFVTWHSMLRLFIKIIYSQTIVRYFSVSLSEPSEKSEKFKYP